MWPPEVTFHTQARGRGRLRTPPRQRPGRRQRRRKTRVASAEINYGRGIRQCRRDLKIGPLSGKPRVLCPVSLRSSSSCLTLAAALISPVSAARRPRRWTASSPSCPTRTAGPNPRWKPRSRTRTRCSKDPLPRGCRRPVEEADDLTGALQSLRGLTAKYPGKPAVAVARRAGPARPAFPEAEASFRALVNSSGPAAIGWMGLARAQNDEGRTADAAASLHRAWRRNLKPPCLDGSRQPRGPPGPFRRWRGRRPPCHQDSPPTSPSAGRCWRFAKPPEKKYDAAISDYQRAIAKAHGFAFAYEGLGICYASTNRPGDAIAPLKAAITLIAGGLRRRDRTRLVLSARGPARRRRESVRQAVNLKPGFSKGWDLLGLAYRQAGQEARGHRRLSSTP